MFPVQWQIKRDWREKGEGWNPELCILKKLERKE
jgi:hypothetical protein